MPEGLRAGVPVHWHETGTGAQPALLLHCALASGAAWGPLADRLGARLHMVAPDMPGHGLSADWDRSGDYHDQVTQIAGSFLDAPCHVIGHSFGATVALQLALAHPAKVQSLVLIEPVLFAAARSYDPAAFADYLAWAEPMADAMAARDWSRAAQMFVTAWGTGLSWARLSTAQQAQYVRQMPIIAATQEALLEDTAGLLASGGLERMRCPVLMLRGARSMAVMAAIHGGLAARIPGAQDRVVAGAGHMLPLTHAARVGAEISAFLEEG